MRFLISGSIDVCGTRTVDVFTTTAPGCRARGRGIFGARTFVCPGVRMMGFGPLLMAVDPAPAGAVHSAHVAQRIERAHTWPNAELI